MAASSPHSRSGQQRLERSRLRPAVEAAHAGVHRMHRAPADGFQDLVADLLHPQGVLDHLGRDRRQVERGGLPEQVRGLQHVDVQGVALDDTRRSTSGGAGRTSAG